MKSKRLRQFWRTEKGRLERKQDLCYRAHTRIFTFSLARKQKAAVICLELDATREWQHCYKKLTKDFLHKMNKVLFIAWKAEMGIWWVEGEEKQMSLNHKVWVLECYRLLLWPESFPGKRRQATIFSIFLSIILHPEKCFHLCFNMELCECSISDLSI